MRETVTKAVQVVKAHRKTLLVFAVFVLLAIALRAREMGEGEVFDGIVERGSRTGSTKSQSFQYHLEDPENADSSVAEIGEQELSLEVSPLQPDREEAFGLLEQAVSEWYGMYLGDNPSAEEVRLDMVLPETMCGGLVTVSYESSDYDILSTSGVIDTGTLTGEGKLVELSARFSCGDYTRIENTALLILPPSEGSAEWIRRELEQEAARTEEESREQETFSLPDAVGRYRVVWERGEDSTWLFFLFLGALAAFCLEWRVRQKERDRQKERAARLESEYPQMVDQFAVLLESGMTIRKAWERILAGGQRPGRGSSKKKRRDSAVYLEEMWITYREIREGRGEREAYERFGDRIGLMSYRRFSSILTQNLSKGTRDVRELLKKESVEALEMRESRARKLGEEAGTKLLFPMLVMLMLILLILLMPALMSL